MPNYECFDANSAQITTIFPSFYDLLRRSLPQEEMRTREGQRALLQNPDYVIWCLQDAGRVTALLAAWELESFGFIEHLAVDESLRGQGIGGDLVQFYCARENRPVLLEVEPPATQIAQRRIGFYERHGFFQNPYPYHQLPLQEGFGEMPLILMSYPRPLEKSEFEAARETLYARVYGQADGCQG